MNRAPSRSMQGFTLPELMLVVIITAILASLSVAGFTDLIQSQKAKSASFDLYSSLILARSEAIKRNANVTVTPVGGSWQAGWAIASGGETIRTQAALGGIYITTGPASVTYTRTGRLPAGTAPTFQIDVSSTATTNVRCVKIELTGMPRTALGACS